MPHDERGAPLGPGSHRRMREVRQAPEESLHRIHEPAFERRRPVEPVAPVGQEQDLDPRMCAPAGQHRAQRLAGSISPPKR